MGTVIANVQADLSKRVAALAGSGDWTRAKGRELLGDGDLDLIIVGYERGLVALREIEGIDGKGKLSMALEDGLAMIATKLNPTMSAEQADAWTRTIRLSLSDLPGRVLDEAVQAALRRTIRFFPEVDGVIRECAEPVMSRHRNALHRLRMLKADLEPISTPRLEAPESPLMSEDELQKLAPHLREMGIGAGWLKEDADGRLSWNIKEDDNGNA